MARRPPLALFGAVVVVTGADINGVAAEETAVGPWASPPSAPA